MLATGGRARKAGVGGNQADRQARGSSGAIQGSPSRLYRRVSGFCGGCDEFWVLSQGACPGCNCGLAVEVRLSARGRLETFAIVRQALPGYRGPLPYAVGAITLPQGIKLRAVVSGCHPEDLRPGMEVELGLVQLCEDSAGRAVVAQAFRPV